MTSVYKLDAKKMREAVRNMGFAHMTDFARSQKFNRATLSNYLKGAGPISESFYKICESLNVDPLSMLTPMAKDDESDVGEIAEIIRALCDEDKNIAVVLLGSRASKKQKKYSDWDIGVTRGGTPLGSPEFLKLKRVVSDLAEDLPRNVDLVNLDAAPEWFLRDITYEPVFLGGNKLSFAFFQGVLCGAKKKK